MVFRSFNRRFFLIGVALSGLTLAAGCQSGSGIAGVGGGTEPKVQEQKVRQSDLLAYCPKVTLRDGTAYFNTYAKGGQDDATKIIYQASVTDVTRDCARSNGQLTMSVGVAGKVVPGPQAAAGTITMPIRIAVLQGTNVLYSKLHQYQVQISDMSAATQFVFKDPNVTVPEPTGKDYQVFAGYDEGPSATSKVDEATPVRKARKPRKKPAVAATPAPASGGAATSLSDIPR